MRSDALAQEVRWALPSSQGTKRRPKSEPGSGHRLRLLLDERLASSERLRQPFPNTRSLTSSATAWEKVLPSKRQPDLQSASAQKREAAPQPLQLHLGAGKASG